MKTHFASPDRTPDQDILTVSQKLKNEILLPWLDAVPSNVLVLDKNRQIVFCNDTFRRLSCKRHRKDVMGMRPGEALNCIHSRVVEAGCGCSTFCAECGAAQAIVKSLQGEADCQDCRMLRSIDDSEVALDLQVFSKPIVFQGETFSLVYALDISHEKRLRYMQRTFYHDLINIAGGVAGITRLLEMEPHGEEELALLSLSARKLIREILYNRDVTAAEIKNLDTRPETFNAQDFINRQVRDLCEFNGVVEGNIEIENNCKTISCDQRILGHVVRNMLINAVEAGDLYKDVVKVACAEKGGKISISVTNKGEVSEKIRKLLFKRYVSTKGEDRGLGAYVMKLMAERYLKGRVSFESGNGETTFRLTLPN